MVLTHLEAERDTLHVSYYETDLHREGILEFTLTNPADSGKVQETDIVDLDVTRLISGKPIRIVLHHADGTDDYCDVTPCTSPAAENGT